MEQCDDPGMPADVARWPPTASPRPRTTMGAMVGSPRESVTKLLGRDHERETIERLLGSACVGEGSALVIRGQAGIGKTALVDLALAPIATMTVLKVTGVEAESDLAFAGLRFGSANRWRQPAGSSGSRC